MDVIGDAADTVAFTVRVSNDCGEVRIELVCCDLVEEWIAVFGAEDDVDQYQGE